MIYYEIYMVYWKFFMHHYDLIPLSLKMQVTEGAAEEEEVRFLMGAFLSSFLH